MISVAEARAILIAHARPTGAEDLSVEDCLGRTLAAPVVARRAQPPFAASAMDGYAVRSTDTPGRLRLIGEAGAGHALEATLGPGECARIFTGAPLPNGADAVVMQEDVSREASTITVPAVASRKHVRDAGLDFAAGTTLLQSGVRLGGASLAAAAAAGGETLTVARRPHVTILAGGDEIVAPGADIRGDQIFDCASFGVSGLAQTWGAASKRGPILKDDAGAIATAIEAAFATSDLVVLIGGASVGDHDHARAAVRAVGGDILFDKVSLRPGKPTWFALRGGSAILGLPGNPGSALVTARLFLCPLITAMLGGDADAAFRPRRAALAAPLPANGPREAYLRAQTHIDDGMLWVTPASNQDSSLISVFTVADALIIRTANADAVPAGARVDLLSI